MTVFTPLPRDDVAANWPWLSEKLEPAVRPDPNMTMQVLYSRLVNGPDLALVASGEASGVVVMEVTEDAECWVKYVAGKITGGPHKRLRVMREAMAWIERAAANAGCVGINVCGRDWSRILVSTGYELTAEWPNGLRKTLKMKEAV